MLNKAVLNMDEFLSWLRDNGALFPKIVWPAETSLGRGAIALEDISPNEIMVEIPFLLMMTPVHAMEDAEIGAIMRENEELLAGDLMLALYLMYEKEKGASSFYAPYISILPSPASIVNWSEEDLALFQDKSLLHAIKFRISDLNVRFCE